MTAGIPSLFAAIRRRWRCFRDGHHWALYEPIGGPDYCKNCGKVVDW